VRKEHILLCGPVGVGDDSLDDELWIDIPDELPASMTN
jgi:hypothetical protein